jgi:NAD(P)-dependent dehydrogenase (short-subunit alcohol dehydrogenase family)
VSGQLREEQNCLQVVERAVREFGGIDVLVSNAAYQMSQDGGIADITSDQFDRVMKTNVYATFWLCKAAVPHLKPGSTRVELHDLGGAGRHRGIPIT